MAQIYERQKGDSEKITEQLVEIKEYSNEILVQQYNRMFRLGLMDVHIQKLYVLALRIEFIRRFGKAPIVFEDNIILRLTEKIDINYIYNH
ncbi:MAG TPA: hypothetical protein EYN07_02350 [Flavobacteriaceae bacterium]|nr:hypothetical protein [Flavobacteriaceae bacterium]HIN98060.1 hypothetical protein [Flavobacteriaceae bacterium]